NTYAISDCFKAGDCIAPDNTRISTRLDCPSSHALLEALPENSKTWVEIEMIECYNDKAYPKPTNLKSDKFRCRKKSNCDMSKYYVDDCTTTEVCTKPIAARPRFTCDADSTLQMKTYEGEQWRKIEQLNCKEERFRATAKK
ncbi:hypothetical protein PFISCL1PPCAC_7593, partial [Pristionchus fissidentatus]